jgi:hypothetical protein
MLHFSQQLLHKQLLLLSYLANFTQTKNYFIMKNLKHIICLLFILFSANLICAQKAKTSTKMTMQDIMSFQKNKADVSKIPNKYSFNWIYRMEIKANKTKAIIFDYFLQPDANYFGTSMKNSGLEMFMIMDNKNKITISAFEKGTKKMAIASKLTENIPIKKTSQSKFTYKPLPNKVILGYNCKGIRAISPDYETITYYTTEAKVSFSGIFNSQQCKGVPNTLTGFFKLNEKPLIMTMEYKDLKNPSNSGSMKCVTLEKKIHSFNKVDYQFM